MNLPRLFLCVATALLSGCFLTPKTSSNSHPQCTTYCHARQVQGCGGDESLCNLGCNTAYNISYSEGKCEQPYIALQDCENDPSILSLGCSPPQSKIDDTCKTQGDALSACQKARDGK